MFAMLFEMTSTLSCWAIMPVAAMLSDCMDFLPYFPKGAGAASGRRPEFLNGLATHLVRLVYEFLGARIGTRDVDHVGHLDDWLHIRAFERALHEAGVFNGDFRLGRVEHGVADIAHVLRIFEGNDGKLAALAAIRGDRAVAGDGDAGFVLGKADRRACIGEDEGAGGGGELAFGVEVEVAIARVEDAGFRLHAEEAF